VEILDDPKAELVTLQQIRCFSTAARTGSFTAASDALGMTQPAVAEHVRNLERSLGVRLFTRLGRGVALTPAGDAFAERAPRVLRELAEAIFSVDEVAALRAGSLAFGLFSTPVAYRIDELAARFCRDHPGLTLRLVGRNSSIAAEGVRSGDLEAALVSLPVDGERLEIRPLARDEVVYVSAHAAHTERAVTIQSLAGRPLVTYDAEAGDSDPIRRQLTARAQEAGVDLWTRVEVETLVLALPLVAAGVGDTYLPLAHTLTPYFPGGLHTAWFEPAMYDNLALVTRRGSTPSPAMRTFIESLETHLAAVMAELQSGMASPARRAR
jgi:DNA-binding transcriptional LysR family regulator